MLKLIELAGLPASGKSTLAKQLVKEMGNAMRLNRDELRAMLFGGKWSGRREKVVIRLQQAMARVILDNGQHVIIDDTNLVKNGLWEGFAKSLDTPVTHERRFLDVSIEECLRRDSLRGGIGTSVGPSVIYRLALRGGICPVLRDNRKLVIFDVDGTLADMRHRVHCIQGSGTKNYDLFYDDESLMADDPIWEVIDWAQAIMASEEYQLICFSGRPGRCWQATMDWLELHGVKPEGLFLRRNDDRRPDDVVKQEMLNDLLVHISKDRIAFVVDDRPRIVRMWQSNGIKVYPVGAAAEGKEF